jgi:hypothetical protein
MSTMPDTRKGSFRLLQVGGQAILAYEPAGADLANYAGDVIMIELRTGTDPKAAEGIANLLNDHVEGVSLKDLSKT